MNISRLRRRAAWGMWVVLWVRAVAPAGGILAAYLVAALFGLGNSWAFAAVVAVALVALGVGLARVRAPRRDEIERRIEQASGLRHRPLAMLEDEPENDAPLAAAIWRVHQRRIAVSLEQARAGGPNFDAAARDPWALRALLLLLLLAGVVIAGPAALPRLTSAFVLPSLPVFGPTVSAWITPPSYTGAPPLVLMAGQKLTVLAGSNITLVVDGERNAPSASLAGKRIGFGDLAARSFRADTVLTASGKLLVGPWWDRLAAWNFTVVPPAGPVLTLAAPLLIDHQLVIGWHVTDKFGLASLAAGLAPVGHAGAAAQVLALPVAQLDPRDASGIAKLDVGNSPYAGLQVTLSVTARNLAGVARSTAPVLLTLPPPNLHDKTALALAALRQALALHPKATEAAGDALRRLAQFPPSPVTGSADVQMAALARALNEGQTHAADAQDRLAALSQEVEAGPDYAPGKALSAANQALEQALQQALNGGKAVEAGRLQSLLAAMHEALARHFQALGQGVSAAGAKPMDTGDLDRMAEQVAADEAAGNSAKAAAELQQLQRILSELQSAKPMTAAQAARSAAANQAAQALSRITQSEAALLDQTNQGGALPSQQQALQNQLSDTAKNLAQAGIKLPGLGDAAGAMGAARNALGQQDMMTASGAEGSAIQALQKAAAALAAHSQGMTFGAGGQSGPADDPSGAGVNGAPDEEPMPGGLPSGGDAAAKIQQQIIRNDSDPALPEAVHQYYHRLLNPD